LLGAVDNDDGSSHYLIHHNFAIYGGAKINNIGGHAQTIHSNIFAFPSVYLFRLINCPDDLDTSVFLD
jgi:hypothetical protein